MQTIAVSIEDAKIESVIGSEPLGDLGSMRGEVGMLITDRGTRRYERLCVCDRAVGISQSVCDIERHAINAADCRSTPVCQSDSTSNVAAISALARDQRSNPVATLASAT